MLKIKNVEVYDLARSIISSRYPMTTVYEDEKVQADIKSVEKYIENLQNRNYTPLYPNDAWFRANDYIKRAMKLGVVKDPAGRPQIGKGHDCFLKGIRVSFDMTYPLYLSRQMQRYNWFDFVSSSSTMHKVHVTPLKDSCNIYVDGEIIGRVQFWIDTYNEMKSKDLNFYAEYDGLEERRYTIYEIYMKVISNLPQGYELTARMSTNYMQLKTMYAQRKKHKLAEDWGYFCTWCESLPLFTEFCVGVDNETI